MKLTPQLMAEIDSHAQADCPREACGLIIALPNSGEGKKKPRKREVVRCRNVAENPLAFWRIHQDDQDAAEERGEIVAVYHSHPYARANASDADLACCEAAGLPFIIYAYPLGEWNIFKPSGYVAPLLEREFVHGVTDCYTCLRDWFKQEKKVELPNFHRPDRWWEDPNGPDLYFENVMKPENGFTVISKDWRDAKIHDTLLMRLMSPLQRINHSAILLDGMKILHHVPGRLSGRENFSQHWQQCVALVVRHKSCFP